MEEGKLTAEEAERLQALAKRDTGSLAINVLMSFGAVAVAAGIIALEPAFMTGAALGMTSILMTFAFRGHKSLSSLHTVPASRLVSNRFCRV